MSRSLRRRTPIAAPVSILALFLACGTPVDLGGPGSTPPGDGGVFEGGALADAGGDVAAGGDCRANVWPRMVWAPISPPRRFLGLDLLKGSRGDGVTLDDAEAALCASIPIDSEDAAWGYQQEVRAHYDPVSRIIDEIDLHPGYEGTLEFTGDLGAGWPSATQRYHYVVEIGQPIQKCNWDGQKATSCMPFEIPWSSVQGTDAALTELYNAVLWEYGPDAGITHDRFAPESNCDAAGDCLVISDDGAGRSYFGARPLKTYVTFPVGTITTNEVYVFAPVRSFPFSRTLPLTLKLDAEGFVAGPTTYPTRGTCLVRAGTVFDSIVNSCVQMSQDSYVNEYWMDRLIGADGRAFGHDVETVDTKWVGLRAVFDSVEAADQAVPDDSQPAAADVLSAIDFSRDATQVPVQNEMSSAGRRDRHGTGLVVREWARLAQAEIARLSPGAGTHALGASECLGASPVAGCTGFEAIVLPGVTYPNDPPDTQKLVAGGIFTAALLAPGKIPATVFCPDPGTWQQCAAPSAPWKSAADRVAAVLGHGDAKALPAALRDPRAYFDLLATAVTRYLVAYAAHGDATTPDDVAAVVLDREALTFSTSGAVPVDEARYVRRDAGGAPSFALVADLADATLRDLRFVAHPEREETALYEIFAGSLASNDVTPTSLFGSPVLSTGWASLHCATTIDAACATPPPEDAPGVLTMDRNGTRPLLAYYPGAFGKTVFAPGASPIVVSSPDDTTTHSAVVTIPTYADPYHPYPAPTGSRTFAVGWKSAATLALPASAGQDKIVTFPELVIDGALARYAIAYTPRPDGTIRVAAMEPARFVGDVFLCRDPATGDLLRAREHTPFAPLVDWVAAHSSAAANCDLVVRVAGNGQATMIASRANGVRLDATPDDGARVARVLLFDPALLP